ncbi:Hsp33 family molecular chaperone [Ahrensia marina]|uniref:Hsp33-like chaperonin n=1 Tax=Ahrensia marina TaxID=1514904 RepID=A0A0N0E6Z5_9HYPH|nr:Hsp33 family molecular chaperone [Ahrensia marina]KPB00591.1 Hsp33-like chaperonin [Ahrensia marina]
MTELNVAEGELTPVQLDEVVPFNIDALDARGRAVLLGPSLTTILGRHDYPEPVARLLGEMTVLTVLLGTSLKFSGKLIVQTQTDGPVSLLVVDFVSPDAIRAYARFDAERVDAAIEAGNTLPTEMLGKGMLALTIDQGKYMSRYQGMVQLDGSSLEEIARNYFKQSEQIPTEVRLAVGKLITRDDEGNQQLTWRAGGLLAQFLPESEDRVRQRDLHPGDAPEGADLSDQEINDDDAWAEVKALVGTIDDSELIDDNLGVHKLLFRLFHERGVRVFDGHPVVDKCSCSREKVEGLLRSFTTEQREEAVEDGKISINCEFCSTHYEFDPSEIK